MKMITRQTMMIVDALQVAALAVALVFVAAVLAGCNLDGDESKAAGKTHHTVYIVKPAEKYPCMQCGLY